MGGWENSPTSLLGFTSMMNISCLALRNFLRHDKKIESVRDIVPYGVIFINAHYFIQEVFLTLPHTNRQTQAACRKSDG